MARIRLLDHSAYSAIALDQANVDADTTTLRRGGDWITADDATITRLVAQFGPDVEVDGAEQAVEAGIAARGGVMQGTETGAPVTPDLSKLDG